MSALDKWNNCENKEVFSDLKMVEMLDAGVSELQQLRAELDKKDAAIIKLSKALIAYDEDHDCIFSCGKIEWGKEKHSESCPMAMAYSVLAAHPPQSAKAGDE